MTIQNNFAIFYAGDAYSTAKKIMGRQSAGEAFMRGVARTWPDATLCGVGPLRGHAQAMFNQLQGYGWTGQLKWSDMPDWSLLEQVGTLYYPSPTARDITFSRNCHNPAAFSVMGVTFTLSSSNAMDAVAELVLPPYKPWDAMICISQAARDMALAMHEEMRSWWSAQTGATRFNHPQLPVIPLGVDAPAFAPQADNRMRARDALAIDANQTVFLFAGRLSFHGKANPLPMYQALEQAAKKIPIVCIEAGIFMNDIIKESYFQAQRTMAPSVRFIWVDGKDAARYRMAWQGADVFLSLSDNIQETFGLTPVEAMAAGLPVIVSDWNGYKETVRDGIDGFRVATVLPPAGTGADLAMRHALELDTYDFYVGRASMATVVDPAALEQAVWRLAADPQLRARMGAAGLAHAQSDFDWPVILRQYAGLADELAAIRSSAGAQPPEPWIGRADPFARFAHFPSQTLGGGWLVTARPDATARLQDLFGLAMANYAFEAKLLPREIISALLAVAARTDGLDVNGLLAAAGAATAVGVRALMWLWKFDLVRIQAPAGQRP